jgi:SAM-dependent methyltransferase
MPVLTPEEYNEYYFEGGANPLAHNAGYTKYGSWEERWKNRTNQFVDIENSIDWWTDMGQFFSGGYWNNKSVLEIGCAYGHLVKALRMFNVDAWGIDVSSFAIGQADSEIAPYLAVGDARTYLSTYSNNQWDWLCSRDFLSCIADADLPGLISEMNRVSKSQLHIIRSSVNQTYYELRTVQEYMAMSFSNGTVFILDNNVSQPYVK